MTRRGPFAVVAMAMFLSASAASQLVWRQRSSAASPPARGWTGMAYDLPRAHTVLFGGSDGVTCLGDTWLWDGTAWTQASPPQSPPARFGHALASDYTRGRVVLFGGRDALQQPLGDTWEWDGTTWLQRSPTLSPSPRYDHTLTQTAAGVMLFGGRAGGALGDMWHWNGTNWAQQFPQVSPPARSGHATFWSTRWGTLVLQGGVGTVPLPETWEWRGGSWQQTFGVGPGTTTGAAMAYDAGRDRGVLFGGTATWEWDRLWSLVWPAVSPPGRSDHAMTHDPLRGCVVLFGGRDAGNVLRNDLWEYQISPSRALWTAFGARCGTFAPQFHLGAAEHPPFLGERLPLLVDRIPVATPAVVALLGFSSRTWAGVPLPLPLDGAGMPGCLLHVTPSVSFPVTGISMVGTASFALQIPANPALLGAAFYMQVVVPDPAANAAGVTVSNAGMAVIGTR